MAPWVFALGLSFFFFPNRFVKNKLDAAKTDVLSHIYVNTHDSRWIRFYLTSVGFGMDAQKALGYNAYSISITIGQCLGH